VPLLAIAIALPNQDAGGRGYVSVTPRSVEYQHTITFVNDRQRRLHAPLQGFQRNRNEWEVEGA
jgi:hypothetical protein